MTAMEAEVEEVAVEVSLVKPTPDVEEEGAEGGKQRPRRRSPAETTNLCSRVTFWFMQPIMRVGNVRGLNMEDVYPLPQRNEAATMVRDFDAARAALQGPDKGQGQEKAGLWRIFFRMHFREIMTSGLFVLIFASLQLLNPILLRLILASMKQPGDDGVYYAAAMFGSIVLTTIFENQAQHLTHIVGQRLRSLCVALVYRKSLSLNTASMHGIPSGQVVNLLSNDSQKFFELAPLAHMAWSAPFQILVSTGLLLQMLGLPALAGVLSFCLVIPVQAKIAQRMGRMRKRHLLLTDSRVKLVSEVLHGMRVVKYYSYEDAFWAKISVLRTQELALIWDQLKMFAGFISFMINAPVFATAATFITYNLAGGTLTSDLTFPALALFNVLRFPLNQLGQVLSTVVQCRVAAVRLDAFLQTEAKPSLKIQPVLGPHEKPAVELSHACFSWGAPFVEGSQEGQEGPGGLADVSLSLQAGHLYALVGPVGSGKSTLVQSILGETQLLHGGASVRGRVAYVPQQAWVLADTVRANITFGLPFEETWYRTVLDACSLWTDLQGMEQRDRTVVGEKGVTLSGGQKQRIAVARAVYSRSDIVVMDDPLSALDAHTGRHVFNALLGKEGLLKDAVVLLVTHATEYLNAVDAVLVMFEGRLAFNGPYEELQQEVADDANTARRTSEDEQRSLRSVLAGLTARAQEDGEEDEDDKEEQEESAEVTDPDLAPTPAEAMESAGKVGPADHSIANGVSVKKSQQLGTKDSVLVTDESRERGGIGLQVLLGYARAAGGLTYLVPMFFVIVAERSTFIGIDWWLSNWSRAGEVATDAVFTGEATVNFFGFELPTTVGPDGVSTYLVVYLGLCVINAFLVLCRLIGMAYLGHMASERLYKNLSMGVLKSPMVFFETTPLGRVLNRFSYDTDAIDYTLVQKMNGAVASAFWLLSSLVVVLNIVPIMGLVFIPVLVVYYFLQRYYRRSCVDLQRLDSTSRSPVQAHFSETLQGLSSIRAFQAVNRFSRTCNKANDINHGAQACYTLSNRWLMVRLECLGATVTLSTSIFCVLAKATISPSLAGLAILWAFNFTTSLNFNVIMSTEAEAKLNGVERVSEYGELTPEQDPSLPRETPPPAWPVAGKIEFQDVTLSYRPELMPALRSMSCTIEAGESIGVVGRTGAGKSTLATCLFRLVEPVSGRVLVDGVDIHKLPLQQVRGGRGKMCIIPQDPVLFSGSVRLNVDPFSDFTDEECWSALRKVRLSVLVKSLPGELHAQVQEGGSNYSVGERQLMCMARALLLQPRVLILDEATASVDHDTDEFIQQTVREAFKGATLISIAHRLNTVMDCDRIMVMSEGKVAEFDSPSRLLLDPGSMFSALVRSTGKANSQHLRAAVEQQGGVGEEAGSGPKSDNAEVVLQIR